MTRGEKRQKRGPPAIPPSVAAPTITRAPLPMVEVQGKSHVMTHVNQAFCRLVEKTRADLIGRRFVEIVPGAEECGRILDQVYQTGEAATLVAEVTSEPEPVKWLYAMWPALDKDEHPAGVVIQLGRAAGPETNLLAANEALLLAGLKQHELKEEGDQLNEQLAAEIAERKHVETALRISERRYRRQFETARDGVIIVSAATRKITDINPVMVQLLEYTRAELLGKELWEIGLLKNKQSSLSAFRQLEKFGFVRYEELPLESKSGRKHEVEVVANLYGENGHSVIQCNVRDITERRHAAEEREALRERERAALAEAEAANRAKDIFLATLSHEIRTPLNAILGWASILKQVSSTPEEFQEGMEVIERSCRMQAQLIEDLLDISRVIAGKLHLEVQAGDLAELVKAAANTVRPSMAAKGVALEVKVDRSGAATACDPSRMQQVIWNLLINAAKFTPRGGAVSIELKRSKAEARITVQDSGEGITADFLPYVFDRFRQADSGSRRKTGGLGLGLSIVKYIVELHGGTVEVQSAGAGRGATFTVKLPVKPELASMIAVAPTKASAVAESRPAGAIARAGPSNGRRLEGVQIVMVEDDPDGRRLLKKVLEQEGALVRACASAIEALPVLKANSPDVLISDISMPEVDGLDLIREVRQMEAAAPRRRAVRAVALTGHAHVSDAARSLEAGFQVHVSKPIDPHQMIDLLAKLARE